MKKIKRFLFAVAVFIVLLILINVFISAIIKSMISDVYLMSLITLMLDIGLSLFFTIKIIDNKTRREL